MYHGNNMRISKEDLASNTITMHALNYQKIKMKSINLKLEQEDLYDHVEKTAHKMVKTCIVDGGVGLAAPQIGVFKRMFIIQDKNDENFYELYINPTWKPREKIKFYSNEGCLSVPGKEYKISRFKHIEVDYWCFDPDKKLINIKQNLDDYWARVFQHEYNHLDGTAIADLYKRQQ